GYIDLSDIEYIYSGNSIGLNKINSGNILITRSGTVGIPVLVTSEFDNLLISADFLKLVLNEKLGNLIINPYFIYIFLSSKLGASQAQRKLIGALQKHINTEGLSSIKIPIPSQSFQQKIEKMVKETQEKRKLADEKYKEAEEILNKELGLGDLDLSTQKTFETKFSEAEDRFDPEYYQSKYKKIISKLKSQKLALLGEIVKIRKGVEVGHEAYANEGRPFIRVQDFDEKELAVGGSTNYIRPYLYEELKKNHKPNAGEIIFSKDGTVGRAFVIREDSNEFIVSGGILILTPRDIDNYYLSFVLNSLAVKSQTIRESIGAIIQHLSIDDVKKLQIPILSQSLQQKISFLIQHSFKLRQEAKELINRAKREVEKIIERE
ncbi:restriction endonuclease subunit S, partial [Patescibacteria group bacterium]|nr:restriction endonuclease subunit S [Patescibacteria group bacterium]